MNQPAISAEQSNGSPWQFLDQQIQTLNAKLFSGLSPVSLAMAQMDWALNLLQTPSAQMQLQADAAKNWGQWMLKALQLKPEQETTTPSHTDARFANSTWHMQPWASLVEAQHLNEQWWQHATQLRGMRPHSKEQMGFYASKWLDMVSPSNWLGSNPEAMEKAMHTGGMSLAKGAQHAFEDWWREHGHQTNNNPQATSLQAGQGLAITPGQVVARSHLCELIQYAPTTSKVHAEPVLIIPSCIMKYYILDLSPHNSMVKWLVSQGHTVYMVSWRNPDENDALLTLDDYVQEGVLASLRHVQQAHREQVHLMGYCLGGTFAAIAAAKLEGEGHEDPHGLASLTLLAAETDFSEPGEMGVLIDEAQVRMLEDMMAHQGFLSGKQMAGSFQFLHSRDLVWSNRTKRWLLGDEDVPNDLMIWNADLTRLPAVMHSQYLRQCFLHNDLANGHFSLNGDTLMLHDIELPIFSVGTVKDHVSPWRSVYKMHHLVSGPVTFALTNGGHNAGIISEPGHHGRHYQLHTTQAHEPSLTSEEWLTQAETHEGSWWTTWSEWLLAHGSGRMVAARKPPQDKELGAAPGQYVMVRYAD